MAKLSKFEVVEALAELSPSDRAFVISQFTSGKGKASLLNLHDDVAEKRFAQGRFCPHCQGRNIVRFGHSHQGAQRYRCNDCRKTFTATTKTIYAHAKNPDLLPAYLVCMKQHLSLRESAKECGVSLRTSFLMRHRILDILAASQPTADLDGIVEADETFLDLSFKGNHTADGFKMPREPHRRGHTSVQRGNSLNKVCVVTAIDRENDTNAVVSNLGVPSASDIIDAIGTDIQPKSVLCTDKSSSYRLLATNNNLDLVRLKGGKIKRGIYHIQNANQLHQSIKEFLGPFHGVATKYLRNYMVWHRVFHFRIGDRRPLKDAKEALLLHNVCSRTREVSARPAVPLTSTRQVPNLPEVMKVMVEKEELARCKLKKNQKGRSIPPQTEEAIPPILENEPF
ncbi:MAG: IS1595 family transposase [Desulfovibrionaceae bacterium]|nr:IS1595 family transposase [Desulfovibrionaceae bacterium]